MVPAPANLRRHFLSWDRPLLAQAVDFLASGWTGAGPLDLSRLLVVVPTRQSGRRLREALAEHALSRSQAVFPPRVLTPDALIAPGSSAGVASRIESLVAWTGVFRALNLAEFREVFPIDPPARGFTWGLRLAEKFVSLQAELAEGGLRLADVPSKASAQEGDFPEAARWSQLGQLERLYAETLAARGRRDLQEAKLALAQDPALPTGIDRIVVLAVSDPIPLAQVVLARHAQTLPVEIAVFARSDESDAFDGWGRPSVSGWGQRVLALKDLEQRVQLCSDPAAQADRVAALARSYGAPDGLLGAGVADPEVLPLLGGALARAGLVGFNPEGQPRRGDSLYHLLSALAALEREPSFDAVATLARSPDFMDFLGARLAGEFSPSRWLAGLDELLSRHLPASLAAARVHAAALERFPELAPALELMEELRAQLAAGDFAAGAAGVPALIFAARRPSGDPQQNAAWEDSAAAWMEVVRGCAAAGEALSHDEAWELALRVFGESARTADKPAGALELQGWLELLFEDAPHLVVAGFNDGRVPDSVAGDPFLPERLREKLGLKTNAARLARDTYLLAALDACRERAGRLDLLVGKVSVAGDPLRPSRLLLQCADADLPRRVEFLFRDTPAARPSLPWRRAWRLRPPPAPRLERIPVTAFRDYLRCPFRFYLKHALGLRRPDPQKAELAPPDFGTLCHTALEAMGRAPALRRCTDAPTLRMFLHEALEREIHVRYGTELSLPVIIQLESARQRLARAAEIQAEQCAQGWVIERVEEKFTCRIGGLRIDGKIDRIERQEQSGRARVIDYKTADTPVSPLEAHSRRVARGGEEAPEFVRFAIGGEERIWTDLQLPLYLHGVASEVGVDALAGYFNLPKAVGEAAVCAWEGYDHEWRAAAQRCAEGVAAAIAANVFWPPAELEQDRDDELFEGLFHHGTAASVDPVFERMGGGR